MACHKLQAFGRKILQTYRNNPHKSDSNTVIKLIAANPHIKTDRARVSEIVTILIAGHDTTGHTLGNLFRTLCQHKDIKTKLQPELAKAGPSGTCSYLWNVVKESDRLLPTTPVVSIRQTGRPFSVGGHFIPKGAIVFLAQILANYDSKIYPHPERFDPDRWDDASVTPDMLETYIPFSVGSRNCLGHALARAELNTVISALFSKYDFELVDPGHMEFFLTLKTVDSKIKATRR